MIKAEGKLSCFLSQLASAAGPSALEPQTQQKCQIRELIMPAERCGEKGTLFPGIPGAAAPPPETWHGSPCDSQIIVLTLAAAVREWLLECD